MREKKRSQRVLALLLALTLLFALSACGKTEANTESGSGSKKDSTQISDTMDSETPDSAEDTEKPLTTEKPTEDRSGAAISIPEEVGRVAVLAPSIAETLINLGCAENIIAIDTQTQTYGYEQLSADLPAFDMMAPDTEQLAALEPDLIFVSGMTDVAGTDLYADLKELGICVINIPSSDSITGIQEDIAFLAACMGKSEEGAAIISDMAEEIDRITEIGKTVTDRKKVYFEIAAAPYAYSFGSETFLNEMIEIIGADNLLSDQTGWLTVDMESVVAANPDVILTNVNYIEDPVGEILSRDGWGQVTAVADSKVYYIDNQSSSLPNENIVKALKEMAEAIYPEIYGE